MKLHSIVECTREKALTFVGKMDGIQTTNINVWDIMNEQPKQARQRVDKLIKRKRFGAFGSVVFTFLLDGIPEILGMILNSEGKNCAFKRTTEIGALPLEDSEKRFYEKWESNLRKCLAEKYKDIEKSELHRMVRRTAGYGISIFAPTVTMVYSVNWGQLNRTLCRMKKDIQLYGRAEATDGFRSRLVPVMKEFVQKMEPYCVGDIDDEEQQNLALFARRRRVNEYGENYCTVYDASLACLAYSLFNRKASYEMIFSGTNKFYVPEVVAKDGILKSEWESDMAEIASHYPRGLMVTVQERGTIEDFERACAACLNNSAHPETKERMTENLRSYVNSASANGKHFIVNDLRPYTVKLKKSLKR